MPDRRGADPNSDFHFVERDEPEKIVATLIKLVQERIPERFGLDPIRDVTSSLPDEPGITVREFNTALQRISNPVRPGESDEVSLAYAVTIHKSQGSEFPAVVWELFEP